MIINKLKSQKGSVTFFVLIAVIFFISIAFIAYASSISKSQSQDLEFSKIKSSYETSYTDDDIKNQNFQKIEENQDEYIKSGLVVHYDGINNTGNGHSNKTNIWKDISGNGNDITLYNFNNTEDSGWLEDGIMLDGIDDYMYRTNPLYNSNGEAPDITIEVVSEKTTSQYGDIINLSGTTNKSKCLNLWTSRVDDGTSRCYSVHWGESAEINIPQDKLNLNELNSISYGVNKNKGFAYLNVGKTNEEYLAETSEQIYTYYNDSFYLGRDYLYANSKKEIIEGRHCYFAGKIKSVRIYNRALTKEEIEHNYNVDYKRFNIKPKEYPSVLDNAISAMPTGSKFVETDSTKGIVISDSNSNQWTWIDVPKEVFTTAKNSTDYDNIKTDLISYAADYREGKKGQGLNWIDTWYAKDGNTLVTGNTIGLTNDQKLLTNGCGLTYSQYNTNYNKMLSSIYTNKGFYIGRYEAGITGSNKDTSLARTKNSGRNPTIQAVAKKDMIPYNFVTCSESQKLASDMATGTKTSSLMFGLQWDLVCKYLEKNANWDTTQKTQTYYINEDSNTWGNYTNSSLKLSSGMYSIDNGEIWKAYNINTDNYVTNKITAAQKSIILTTGASEYTNKMNIFDFAGNGWEYTLECSLDSVYACSIRGGTDSASRRGANGMTGGNALYLFRPTLY